MHKKHDGFFYQAMLNPKFGKVAIIAEIKLASPSEGVLGTADDITVRVRQYEQAGADAISIVTEKYFFHGETEFVGRIKKEVSLPVLQKDFVTDEYQIYESKFAGADAILLIARLVDLDKLRDFTTLTKKLDMEAVVEINSQADLTKAVETSTNIIAVNSRDLDTFEVDVDRACKLLKKVPEKFLKLGFSGIHSRIEVEKYKQAGAKAVLVGTELMKTFDINKKILELKMSVQVKICGIRTLDAALTAVDAGADFLGFNFVETSKRYINPINAKKIINLVKSKVKVVGVFQDADLSYINKIAANLGLDFVQLHGNEDNKYISQLNLPVIKSITINDQPQKIHAKYFLLDRPGRKGEMVNVEKAAQLATQFPIFFAGGLNPDNVAEVVKQVRPFAVDIAGGVETKGVQDSNKIKLFIKNSREVT